MAGQEYLRPHYEQAKRVAESLQGDGNLGKVRVFTDIFLEAARLATPAFANDAIARRQNEEYLNQAELQKLRKLPGALTDQEFASHVIAVNLRQSFETAAAKALQTYGDSNEDPTREKATFLKKEWKRDGVSYVVFESKSATGRLRRIGFSLQTQEEDAPGYWKFIKSGDAEKLVKTAEDDTNQAMHIVGWEDGKIQDRVEGKLRGILTLDSLRPSHVLAHRADLEHDPSGRDRFREGARKLVVEDFFEGIRRALTARVSRRGLHGLYGLSQIGIAVRDAVNIRGGEPTQALHFADFRKKFIAYFDEYPDLSKLLKSEGVGIQFISGADGSYNAFLITKITKTDDQQAVSKLLFGTLFLTPEDIFDPRGFYFLHPKPTSGRVTELYKKFTIVKDPLRYELAESIIARGLAAHQSSTEASQTAEEAANIVSILEL